MDAIRRMEVMVGGAKSAETKTAATSMDEGGIFSLENALVVECPDGSSRGEPPLCAVVYGRNR